MTDVIAGLLSGGVISLCTSLLGAPNWAAFAVGILVYLIAITHLHISRLLENR